MPLLVTCVAQEIVPENGTREIRLSHCSRKAPLLGAAVSRRLMLWIQRDHEADRHGLNDREWEILQLAARGKQGPEIVGLLEISNNAVKNYFRNIYTKLDVHSRADALIKINGD